jgi:hypothetical protein
MAGDDCAAAQRGRVAAPSAAPPIWMNWRRSVRWVFDMETLRMKG